MLRARIALIAQLAERKTFDLVALGSIPNEGMAENFFWGPRQTTDM